MQYTYRQTQKIYAQWNWPSVTKPNPESCNNCSSKGAYHCAQLSYTTQHGAVLIIFLLNLQTSITAQMQSIGGEGKISRLNRKAKVTGQSSRHRWKSMMLFNVVGMTSIEWGRAVKASSTAARREQLPLIRSYIMIGRSVSSTGKSREVYERVVTGLLPPPHLSSPRTSTAK